MKIKDTTSYDLYVHHCALQEAMVSTASHTCLKFQIINRMCKKLHQQMIQTKCLPIQKLLTYAHTHTSKKTKV